MHYVVCTFVSHEHTVITIRGASRCIPLHTHHFICVLHCKEPSQTTPADHYNIRSRYLQDIYVGPMLEDYHYFTYCAYNTSVVYSLPTIMYMSLSGTLDGLVDGCVVGLEVGEGLGLGGGGGSKPARVKKGG